MGWTGLVSGYKGIPPKISKKIGILCARCAKEFPVTAAKAATRVHCSKKCAAEANASRLKSTAINKAGEHIPRVRIKPGW